VKSPDLNRFESFEEASREVLDFLHQRFGFDLWMVTRVQEDDWIILQASDHGYGVTDGTVLRWADSFCSRMTQGKGPMIAPRSEQIEAYAHAPIGQQLKIGAYMGVPLRHPDGRLFGTMCAIDPNPRDDIDQGDLPLLELLARLLSTILSDEIEAIEHQHRMQRVFSDSRTDSLTGLPNRRAWDETMQREGERLRQIGGYASIFIVDLDDLKAVNDSRGHQAGDELIRTAASVLEAAIRNNDFVARIGGDEFGIVATDEQAIEDEKLLQRMREKLAEADVSASIGAATWRPGQTLMETWEKADAAMYREKRRHAGP